MRKITLPEEKLNELAQQISERMLSNHFFEKGVIRGEELKGFSDHSQINKFLLFQVFQVWDMQIAKLKHPYFDFDQADIQESLKALKNSLSQHIRISEEDFKPMLKRAVYNNLRLILDPKEAITSFFFHQGEKISFEVYQRYSQFFSDLGFVISSILKYYQKNNIDTVEKDVYFLKMEKVIEVYDKKSEKDFDAYRADLFESLSGVKLSSILDEITSRERQAEEAKRRQEEDARQKEEEARQKEEEARRKEEEARLLAEEAKRKEEEARRREEEERKRREEEARRKKEEEAKKASFFDTLANGDEAFDLDLDEEDILSPKPEVVAKEETIEVVVPEEKPVVKTEIPVVEIPVAKIPEPKDEVLEMSEAFEPKPQAEPKPEPKPEVKPEPKPEVKPEPKVEKTGVSASVVEEVLEMMEKPMETVVPPKKESTMSFLDRFLNEKENGKAPETRTDKPTSILDKINETTAKTTGDAPKQILDKLNGSRKIKLDEIPIHKQYQYVQKVFDGNNVRFRIIVDKVNNAKNSEEVEDILDKFVFNNTTIDREDQVVVEFITLLRNRF
ncbi:MAG: hypothetical protein SF052_24830 [Bacteroidia bacterium]|nr:hypothetical protein [Bacteroidia bacterium]